MKKKAKKTLLLVTGITTLGSCAYLSKSTLDIPEKRNFPVNSKISPCEDFHKYTCSVLEGDFKLPSNRSRYIFAFSDSSERILNFKKEYFKKLNTLEPKDKIESTLKTIYSACMDKKSSFNDENSIKNKLISDLSQLNTRTQLLNYLSRQIISPQEGFIRIGVINNQDKPSYNDLFLLPNTMSLPEKTYYQNSQLQKDFIALTSLLFQKIGKKNPEQIAKNIFAYEKALADVFPTPLQFRKLITTRTGITKKEILKKYPNLNLKELLKKTPNRTHIRNFTPLALAYTNQMLGGLSLETIKNIYLFQNLKDILDESAPEYIAEKTEFESNYLGGPNERPDRQERCTRVVMDNFQMELDFILVPKMFPNFPRERFVQLAESIRQTLIKTLKENKWLSSRGRIGAIKKISKAKLYLVTPLNEKEWNFNPTGTYSRTTPISNILQLHHLKTQKKISELGTSISDGRWEMGPLRVNAYYDPTMNHFVLPIAILQAPFFDTENTRAQNLAAIGTVIGHELGHGIDDQGRKYDYKGQLRSWVSKSDIKELKKRTDPLISQFKKVNHNGELTLGENIGDLVGLSTSFRTAFPNYKSGTVPKKQLQEFFLQYARVWCEVQTPSMRERRLKTDPHALGFARINEQMKHQPAFKDAYSCKEEDPMVLNKNKVIQVW